MAAFNSICSRSAASAQIVRAPHRLQFDGQRRIDIVITEVVFLQHRVVQATRQASLLHVLNLQKSEDVTAAQWNKLK